MIWVHVSGVFVDHECHRDSRFLRVDVDERVFQACGTAALVGELGGRGTRPCLLE